MFFVCLVIVGVIGIFVQFVGGDGVNCRYGGDCGVNWCRWFWCVGFLGAVKQRYWFSVVGGDFGNCFGGVYWCVVWFVYCIVEGEM